MRKTDNLLLWTVIVLFYYGVYLLMTAIPEIGSTPSLHFILSVAFIIITLHPLRRNVRLGLIRLLNPTYFEKNNQIKSLKQEIRITQTYEEIADKVLEELEKVFEAKILAIIFKEDSKYQVVNFRAPEPINLDNVTIDGQSDLIERLKEKDKIVKVDQQYLEYNPTPQRKMDYRFKDYRLFSYAIPLKVNEVLVGAILTSNLPKDFIRDWENGLLEEFTRYLAVILRDSRIYNELRWEALQKNTLFEISKKITASLELREVLDLVINSLNKVVNYDAAGIFLVSQSGRVVREMAHHGYDSDKISDISLKVGQGIVGACIRERRPIILGDVSRSEQYINIREDTSSEMCVPIYDNKGEQVIGAFNVESDKENAFSRNDLERLTAFTEHVAIAIQNASLYREVTESRQIERDIEVAKEIQSAFLPKSVPHMEDYAFAAICKPSQKVGGDFYDIHQFNSDKVGIAIGDVSGKGVPGAILMANLYAGYRSRLRSQNSISGMVGRLNDLLIESTNSEKYTTFFYGELETKNRTFTYSNGGHNPPLVFHPDGNYEELNVGGPVIGALENSVYQEQQVQLLSGDLLLLYTDGLTEAQNAKGEYYEDDRLIRVIQNRDPEASVQEIMDMINRDVYSFSKEEHLQDDITIVLMMVKPQLSTGNGSTAETA